MEYIVGEGEAQTIVTGEIGGIKWRGKIDRLHKGGAIVDLKVVASIRDRVWDDFTRTKIDFITASGYIDQGAVYQELWRQMSGEKLPFFIAAITKEEYPDKEIILTPDELLEHALDKIKEKAPYLQALKDHKYPPVACGVCNYCRSVKKLEQPIVISDL